MLNLVKRAERFSWSPEEERKRQERWQREQERMLQVQRLENAEPRLSRAENHLSMLHTPPDRGLTGTSCLSCLSTGEMIHLKKKILSLESVFFSIM